MGPPHSCRGFMLGPWLRDAEGWAADAAEATHFRSNLLTQITIWGTTDGNASQITELDGYANRQWSSLMGSYYRVRCVVGTSLLSPISACVDLQNLCAGAAPLCGLIYSTAFCCSSYARQVAFAESWHGHQLKSVVFILHVRAQTIIKDSIY